MRCPYCGSLDTQVKDSRPTEDSSSIRRRRICPDCGGRFTTFERVQLRELTVVKKTGRRVPFDRDKLTRSINIALRKRPIEPDRVERLVNGIVRQLESSGETDIASDDIGKIVMEGLKGLDSVAYVRFASVYRDFSDAKDFGTLAEELSSPGDFGRRGMGRTGSNPSVGALVVKDGIVIGRGFTQAGGRPHAEPVALAQAGVAAKGATLYVTLEPCSHFGKSPPCVDAIIQAGIARVVSALEDPNPLVGGQGHDKLWSAGIEVVTDVCAGEARRAHLGHILRVTQNRPMVTLKLAQTADGYAAGGVYDHRLMITGQAANARVQILRSLHDAIMVGIGTALEDDPLMTVRIPGASYAPLRVVLDSEAILNPRSRLAMSAGQVPVLVFVGPAAPPARITVLRGMGVMVENLPLKDGRLDLNAALRALSARGILRVFSEGGPRVAASLIEQGLADEVVLFSSHKPFGREGVPALSAQARDHLADPAFYTLQRTSLMFTGLVSDVGEVVAIAERGSLRRMRIACSYPLESIALGASIACAGVCLTAVDMGQMGDKTWFDVDAAAETLSLTTLKNWTVGRKINLERSLKIGDELGGHIVTGHVDGLAHLLSREDFEGQARFTLRAPQNLKKFIAQKGSVALDGTSLTVNTVVDDVFSVLLIPHTLAVTSWGATQSGDMINLEVDMMARYAARLSEAG
eukprot:gene13921-14038_t